MIDFEARARDAMAAHGLNPRDVIIDSQFHRFDGDKKGGNSCWYIFHYDAVNPYGSFGDWANHSRDGYFSFKSQSEMSEGERALYLQRQDEDKKKRAKLKTEAQNKAKSTAIYLVDKLQKREHGYTARKQIPLYGSAGILKPLPDKDGVAGEDMLVIPAYKAGLLVGMQRIWADGSKNFLKNAPYAGAYFLIGDPATSQKIMIAEGYATGASVHMATGFPVIVTFNDTNMLNVFQYWKKTLPPETVFTICADNDESGAGLAAAKKCKGAVIRMCPVATDYNDLHVAQGLQAVKEAIFPPVIERSTAQYDVSQSDYEQRGWWDDWVYINHEDKFYSLATHMRYSITAFNLQNGKLVPESDKGGKGTASSMVTNDSLVRVVAKAVYAPNVDEVIFKDNNLECVNVFNPKTLPKAAAEYTQAGRDAIDMIRNHIFYICNCNEEHTALMLNWIAWQLQRKGEKILWCPVIQGVEGTGKSFFADLLEHLLGHENINTVAPREVLSQFNGWATNACVSVLSEIRLVNQDRYEAVNALKPLITDQVVQINIKNVPAYNVRNVTNYICMTNFKDAIPVTATDRRWWILYSDYDTLDDFLQRASPDDADGYFMRLYNALRGYSSEVVKWFSEYAIHPDFERIKQAPKTIYKDALLRNEQEKSMPIHDAIDLLEEGGYYFNSSILCAGDFFDRLKDVCADFNPQTSQRATFLMKLGFSFYKTMKIDGKTRKIWCKKLNLEDDYIKEELRKTLYI